MLKYIFNILNKIYELLFNADGIASTAGDIHAPADNTSAVVTYAALADKKHYLYDIFWSYDSTVAVTGTLSVSDNSVVVFGPLAITTSGPGFVHFSPAMVSSLDNKAMVITLTTGGESVGGSLSCRHRAK